MRNNNTKLLTFTAALTGSLASFSLAQAQDYPVRPVTLVVPYAAGGPTDLAARTLAQKVRDLIGQPVIIENKGGGGTTVGAAAAAKAQPDGYTLLMITASTVATAPHLYKKLNYKVEDFAPVAMIAKLPLLLATRKDLPFKNVSQLIAYAKTKPEGLTYATSGTGSTTHLAGLLLAKTAGIQLREVPYRSSALGVNDLLGGNVDLAIDGAASLTSLHDTGKVQVVGNFSDKRWPLLPDVVTFKESGLQNVVVDTWYAIVVPTGTPAPVVQKLNAAFKQTVDDPEIRQKLLIAGMNAESSTPEGLATLIKQEYDLWGQVIKEAGLPQLD